MIKPRTYKDNVLAVIHETATGMFDAGVINKRTMRQFDETCLAVPTALEPTQAKHMREQARVSQLVFARYLNTSESTVQKWESGSKQPSGMALKLLAVVQKHGLEVLA